MISDRTRGIYQLTLVGQCALTTLVFWGWILLWHARAPQSAALVGRYLAYNQFLLVGLLVGGSLARVSSTFVSPSFELASRYAFRQLGIACLYLFLFLVAVREGRISWAFLLSFVPLLYCTLFVTNRYLPRWLSRGVFRGEHQERLLLVGAPAKAALMREWLANKQQLGLRAVGLLADRGPAASAEAESPARPAGAGPFEGVNLPLLGGREDLARVVETHQVTQVVLVEFPEDHDDLRGLSTFCEERGLRLLVVSDLDSRFRHAVAVFEDQSLFFIGLREEPLESPFNRVLKRAMDVAVAVPVVVGLLPVAMLVVRLLQWLQSPGPLFFHQRRMGMHGHAFDLIKFRTMRAGHQEEARQATAGDPRIYPAGRWLRKFSLDELPQFLNVLRGDMSVVGPRPHLPEHDAAFARVMRNYYIRAAVKPGITGLAQVSGFRGEIRDDEDVIRRVEADIRYLENWSFWLDGWLVLRTSVQVMFPPQTAV